MTDRELLELAAKAYWGEEIDDVCTVRWLDDDQAIGYTHGDNQDHNGQDREFVWNPLEYEGDALLAAVKARLQIDVKCDGVYVGYGPRSAHSMQRQFEVCERFAGDEVKATCRAIVRALAAIGGAA